MIEGKLAWSELPYKTEEIKNILELSEEGKVVMLSKPNF